MFFLFKSSFFYGHIFSRKSFEFLSGDQSALRSSDIESVLSGQKPIFSNQSDVRVVRMKMLFTFRDFARFIRNSCTADT